jgi:hypothetical protein
MKSLAVLEQQIKSAPLVWKPKSGEILAGTILDVGERINQPLTLQDESGKTHLVPKFAEVRELVGRHAIQPGYGLVIRYLGKNNPSGRKPQDIYSVLVEPQGDTHTPG